MTQEMLLQLLQLAAALVAGWIARHVGVGKPSAPENRPPRPTIPAPQEPSDFADVLERRLARLEEKLSGGAARSPANNVGLPDNNLLRDVVELVHRLVSDKRNNGRENERDTNRERAKNP